MCGGRRDDARKRRMHVDAEAHHHREGVGARTAPIRHDRVKVNCPLLIAPPQAWFIIPPDIIPDMLPE